VSLYLLTVGGEAQADCERFPSIVMATRFGSADASSAAAWLLASFVPRGLSPLASALMALGARVAPLAVVEVVESAADWPAPDAVLGRQECPRSG